MTSSYTSSCMLLQLPRELQDAIVSFLTNRDIKNLRTTCSALEAVARLRLSRVFLSANSLNVKVFRAIADHDIFRHGVTEIIWDDARLVDSLELAEDRDDYVWGEESNDTVTLHGCPRWFRDRRASELDSAYERDLDDEDDPDGVLSLEDSWSYYQGLLHDQEQVLASNADEEAFKYGLKHFPSLKRVTITPGAHGILTKPLYETPMIRNFPFGFAYPIPRGWPNFEGRKTPIDALPWEVDDTDRVPLYDLHVMYDGDWTIEDYRNKWHGFRLITRLLAENKEHQVSEFVIDVHQIETGVNCHIFDQPCPEYHNLAALLKRHGFRRFDLALLTGFLEHEDWVSYRSGLLRSALAAAKDLEHISLRSGMAIDENGYPRHLDLDERDPTDPTDYSLPLRTIFPIDDWPRLRHFGLSRFLVQQSDLIALLAALPPTLRSVELSFLGWLDEGDCYRELLVQMRNTLDWRARPEAERPKVKIGVLQAVVYADGQAIWVDKAVDSFIYDNGINPFGTDCGGNSVVEGRGGFVRNGLDPSFERPY